MSKLFKLKEYMNNLLFPREYCLLCSKQFIPNNRQSQLHSTSKGKKDKIIRGILQLTSICQGCKEELEPPLKPYCSFCHKPLSAAINQSETLCKDCVASQEGLSFNRSAVIYNTFMKDKIALYKYRGKESLAQIFGQLLKITFDYYYSNIAIDYLSYIPLHEKRLKERGFNQAEQLAKLLGHYTGRPVFGLLSRAKETDKQSKRTKQERILQIKDSFIVKEEFKESIANKNILIVDDIFTTGSTMLEVSHLLKKYSAKEVYSLTLTRAIELKYDDKLDNFV